MRASARSSPRGAASTGAASSSPATRRSSATTASRSGASSAARARARLQVHPPARARRPAARHPRDRVPQGLSARPASRTRCTASRQSGRRRRSSGRSRARSPPRGARRARRASTASRSTARTATSSRSSSPRRSTTATTSTAARSRTARGCSSRPCARSGEVGDDFHLQVKISATRGQRRLFLAPREAGRRVGAGVPLARGGGRGRDPRPHLADSRGTGMSLKEVRDNYDGLISERGAVEQVVAEGVAPARDQSVVVVPHLAERHAARGVQRMGERAPGRDVDRVRAGLLEPLAHPHRVVDRVPAVGARRGTRPRARWR